MVRRSGREFPPAGSRQINPSLPFRQMLGGISTRVYRSGWLIFSEKAENISLKLTLILVSSLPPASTECANQVGNMRSTSDASKLAP